MPLLEKNIFPGVSEKNPSFGVNNQAFKRPPSYRNILYSNVGGCYDLFNTNHNDFIKCPYPVAFGMNCVKICNFVNNL
jgi:hypothetical protein